MAARKTGFVVGAVAGVGVACAALAGVGLRMTPASAQDTQPALLRTSSVAPIFAPPPGAPMSFADIFEKVSPSVVSIDVTSRAQAQANPLAGIPGLENFPFGGQAQPRGGPDDGNGDDSAPGGGGARGQRQMSSGSGFFVSEDGFIVTNNHVVENAEEISITLKDGKEYKATVVGKDEGTDLAVIKVDDPKAKGIKFPYVSFENSAKPRVGDWVITIGNPFGLGGTATAGIISAYGRDIGDTSFVDYIQIDAPINRGNSGGPSFDIFGRVIGVNSAIFSPSGGSVGIGFAIPADTAESITRQLMTGSKITRGYIGATIQPFTDEMAETQGLAGTQGAIVADLVAGGPAESGGLRRGDIVTTVNGVGIKNSSELTREVAKNRPGDTIRLDVLRDGRRQQVAVRSGQRPSETELASNDNTDGGPRQGAPARPGAPVTQQVLGLQVTGIDAAARQRYSLSATVTGVVIDSVRQGSDAADKGLRRGDVITSINQKPLTSAADAAAAVEAAKKAGRTSVLAGFYRNGRPGFLPLKIE
jgi:serine protease Do